MSKNRDVYFSQSYLSLIRREAKKAKIKLPTHLTAIKSGVGTWWLVEGKHADGSRLAEEVCADNAYDARAKVLERIVDKVEASNGGVL